MNESTEYPAPTPQPKLSRLRGRWTITKLNFSGLRRLRAKSTNQSAMAILGALLATASYFGNNLLLESSKRKLEELETAQHIASTARTLQRLNNTMSEIQDQLADIHRDALATELHISPSDLISHLNSGTSLHQKPSPQSVHIVKSLESVEDSQVALHSFVDAMPDDELWAEHVDSPRHQLQILEEDLGRLRNRWDGSKQDILLNAFLRDHPEANLAPKDQHEIEDENRKLQHDLDEFAKRQVEYGEKARLRIGADIEDLEYGMAFWNCVAGVLFLVGLYWSTVGKIGGAASEPPGT